MKPSWLTSHLNSWLHIWCLFSPRVRGWLLVALVGSAGRCLRAGLGHVAAGVTEASFSPWGNQVLYKSGFQTIFMNVPPPRYSVCPVPLFANTKPFGDEKEMRLNIKQGMCVLLTWTFNGVVEICRKIYWTLFRFHYILMRWYPDLTNCIALFL